MQKGYIVVRPLYPHLVCRILLCRKAISWSDPYTRIEAGRDERYNYLYSKDELEDIGETAQNVARKVESLYLITNNHYRGQAAVNALQLMDMISDTSPPGKIEYSRQIDLWE